MKVRLDPMLPLILIFLKAPRKGLVKSRLAADIGESRALEIYRYLVERQMAALPSGWGVEVHYSPSDAAEEMREWLGAERARYAPQVEGDLGNRLAHAVKEAFQRGARSVICIGADCPELEDRQFKQARQSLENSAEIVFGPAEDGGYYLLGLNAFYPELFRDIPWSNKRTLSVSLEKAHTNKRRVVLLEKLLDIDRVDDLRAWNRNHNQQQLPFPSSQH